MSQILCCPVAWMLELRSIRCLLQTRPPRRIFWYYAILLSSYTYKGYVHLKICLWASGGPSQNRRQIVFNRGVCAGGLTYNLTKIPLSYSVSYFTLEGLGALFGGAKPTKAPPWRRDWVRGPSVGNHWLR